MFDFLVTAVQVALGAIVVLVLGLGILLMGMSVIATVIEAFQ